jgi:hypothetical protein
MARTFVWALVAIALLVPRFSAHQGVRSGKIEKVNADKGTLIITVDGKDRDLKVGAPRASRSRKAISAATARTPLDRGSKGGPRAARVLQE